MKTTDDTPVASVNALATLLCENYGPQNTPTKLSATLADIVGDDTTKAEILGPNGNPIPHNTLPNILCGHSGCTVKVTRGNGLSATLAFPSTVKACDDALIDLGRRKTTDEARFVEFENALLETLDAYGHLTWTVGNEDWIACADASLGVFDGDLYLAWHVVVDCESGGFTETKESGCVKVDRAKNPPQGILARYYDLCWQHYAYDQDPDDPDKEYLQIDSEGSTRAVSEFDEKIRTLWNDDPDDPEQEIAVDWDEQEDPFDPVAWGWVGDDGQP